MIMLAANSGRDQNISTTLLEDDLAEVELFLKPDEIAKCELWCLQNHPEWQITIEPAEPEESQEKLVKKVHVNDPDGLLCTVSIETTATVFHLKQLIHRATRIAAREQKLMSGCRILKDHEEVREALGGNEVSMIRLPQSAAPPRARQLRITPARLAALAKSGEAAPQQASRSYGVLEFYKSRGSSGSQPDDLASRSSFPGSGAGNEDAVSKGCKRIVTAPSSKRASQSKQSKLAGSDGA
eukprot:TRINITY_DN94349_c0_g1_i1.p1 TRINITY_DN94349_c0_g1~~TRINITY_DN94349_c0_g1_i1.p1  ORF type:complete len:240 (+),score=40.33 TRINITY_DN94349_c0_g1_i1:60-779(+)